MTMAVRIRKVVKRMFCVYSHWSNTTLDYMHARRYRCERALPCGVTNLRACFRAVRGVTARRHIFEIFSDFCVQCPESDIYGRTQSEPSAQCGIIISCLLISWYL